VKRGKDKTLKNAAQRRMTEKNRKYEAIPVDTRRQKKIPRNIHEYPEGRAHWGQIEKNTAVKEKVIASAKRSVTCRLQCLM